MKKGRYSDFLLWVVSGMFIWGIMGCASPQLWYKPGHNQVNFTLDEQECLLIAQEAARQKTITGEKAEQTEFYTIYNNCLFSRGWSHNPPGREQKNVEPAMPAIVDGNQLSVFDKHFVLPAGFNLVNNKISRFEDVNAQTLFLQGAGLVFLNIYIQETGSRKFDVVDYPIQAPFFVFERGNSKPSGLDENWVVFSGEFDGEWLAGVGAYLVVAPTKRIGFVMTKPMSKPESTPPKGLKLAKNQKLELDAFSDQWWDVFKQAFGVY
ncbi:MAG: hypothetical protein ABIJ31_00685 [Pseudomonadota bacterium]